MKENVLNNFRNLPLTRKLLTIVIVSILLCCGCTFSAVFVDVVLRDVGVLPTYTPTTTPTNTPTPTQTPLPTYTATATSTAVPTNTPAPSSTPIPTKTPQPAATNTPRPTATQLPPTALPVPITLIGLTSPITPNSDATLTIQTEPGITCNPGVRYASGDSIAEGMEPKTASNDGVLSWTWKVGQRTNAGTWTVYINCGGTYESWPFVVE